MSTYTVSIQELVNDDFDFGLTRDDYPLFDDRYRGIRTKSGRWEYVKNEDGSEFLGLNKKILDHYLYAEIGQETPDMFRQMLNRKLREIMPYYNQLYETQSLISDPFETMRMSQKADSSMESEDNIKNDVDNTGSSSADSTGRTVTSQFPQTTLHDNSDYASSAVDSFSKSTGTQESKTATTEDRNTASTGQTVTNVSGSVGARSRLLADYRQTFLNIDLMVIQDLGSLFMIPMHKFDSNYGRRPQYGYGPYLGGIFPAF